MRQLIGTARIIPVRESAGLRITRPKRRFAEVRDKPSRPTRRPVDLVQLLLEDRKRR